MDRKRLVLFARERAPFDALLAHGPARFGSWLLALACCVSSAGCEPPLGDEPALVKKDAGSAKDAGSGRHDGGTHQADSGQVDDPVDDDAGDPALPAAVDAGASNVDAGLLDVSDASSTDAAHGDGSAPPVISAPVEVMKALCSDAYDSVKLTYSAVTRGSWQFNPGGAFVKLSQPGYPCHAFLEDQKARPATNDPRWSDAADGAFLGFSEKSAIPTMTYTDAQFRYFRSYIFVPVGANLKTLSVKAIGIDDSVHLELTNSRYPKGTSPRDVGPSDPDAGACQGNGDGEWNLAKYMVEGEINVLLLVHADMAATTSTLLSVDVRADGAPIQLVSCKK